MSDTDDSQHRAFDDRAEALRAVLVTVAGMLGRAPVRTLGGAVLVDEAHVAHVRDYIVEELTRDAEKPAARGMRRTPATWQAMLAGDLRAVAGLALLARDDAKSAAAAHAIAEQLEELDPLDPRD